MGALTEEDDNVSLDDVYQNIEHISAESPFNLNHHATTSSSMAKPPPLLAELPGNPFQLVQFQGNLISQNMLIFNMDLQMQILDQDDVTPTSPNESQPYVSPFEDLPPEPVAKPLPWAEIKTVLPAGYDLNNLRVYKDPNHWHIRPTTLNDTRP